MRRLLIPLLFSFSCSSAQAEKTQRKEPVENPPLVVEDLPTTPPIVVSVEKEEPWNLPYVCETFKVVHTVGNKYPEHKRIRTQRSTKKTQQKARDMARLVAREMGADPRLLLLWMFRGSTSNPRAIHILNRDLRADWRAWNSHQWSQGTEDSYREILAKGKQHPNYYKAKAALKKILIYKDNDYFFDTFEYEEFFPGGEQPAVGLHPYFAMKYGPLDMSAVGYTKVWSSKAPPWIMCNDEGLLAYIVGVWSMRKFQNQCKNEIEYGDSYGVIDRRYAIGHCSEASAGFKKRALRYDLDPNEKARLGSKWLRTTTDRQEIYDHIKKKAIKKGLLSNE